MFEELIEIGRVKSTNASKRAIKIAPLREVDLRPVTWLHVRMRDGETLRLKVAAASKGDEPTVEFVPGVPRELVGRMEKATVLAPASALPQPEAAEWTLDELEGMTAVTVEAELGAIVEVQYGPAHGWVTIETIDGTRWIVAAVPPAVAEVDKDAMRVTLTPEWQHFAVEDAPEAEDAD